MGLDLDFRKRPRKVCKFKSWELEDSYEFRRDDASIVPYRCPLLDSAGLSGQLITAPLGEDPL